MSLTADGGPVELQPVGFHGHEAVSEPFSIVIEMHSTSPSLDPNAYLYKPMCLTVARQHSGKRHFNGLVRRFQAVGKPSRSHWRYVAEIVPRLWFLGQTTDCRIFQGQSVADIVQTICDEHGQQLDIRLYGGRPDRDYITQFNETDLEFVGRLCESEGYHYHFDHTPGSHVMVLSDDNQGFAATPKPSMRVVHAGGNVDVLTEWENHDGTVHGKVTLSDYDPAKPSPKPTGQQSTTLAATGAPKRDVFHWPAGRLTSTDAAKRARHMIEAAEAQASVRDGAGENHVFTAGGRFVLATDPFDGASNVEYIVVRITHEGRDEGWITGGNVASYSNRFTASPAKTPWRQPQTTPRPVMAGLYAGIVLGPKGEEIHADDLGRVKVQMFFDRREETAADKAIWARIVQPWAGNTWGWQHLPRVGSEVAVCFMDGDPDRPVVMGGLYNGEQKPVFPIPAQQTKSGLRTRSTKSGGTTTFSELSFDDKKGSELLYVHAEKDMTVEVEHDQSLTVDNDRHHVVKQKETTEVGDSQTNTVKNGRTTTVSAAGDKLTVEGGDLTIKVSSGAVSVEAMTSITLTVGSNSVTIDQQGVTIKGMMVSVEGQMKADMKAAMVQVSGDSMLTLKGGITNIN